MDFSFLKLITPENVSLALSASTAAATATFFIMRRVHNIRVKALETNLADERKARTALQEEHEKRFQIALDRHTSDLERLRQRYETEMQHMRERIEKLENRWEQTVLARIDNGDHHE